MSKTALLFAGQGAQAVGMGKDFAEKFPSAKTWFDRANAALGYGLASVCFDGPEPELIKTGNAQPGIFLVSWVAFELLKEHVPALEFDATAGLSLGEFTALAAAGEMSFEDGLRAVRQRGRFMQEAVPAGVGGMAAILGLTDDQVVEVCRAASAHGIVEPANFNCPGQVVVAGEAAAVDAACALAKEAGAKRAMPLAVSAPFHCSLLKPAGEKLAEALASVELHGMSIPVVSNVTGGIVGSAADVKDLLVRQVSSPVRWEACIRTLLENGVDTFVEIGPGKVLNGFIRKIDKDAVVYNADDRASINATIAALKG